MKRSLKSIAICQMRMQALYAEAIQMQRRSLGISQEMADLSRENAAITRRRFEMEMLQVKELLTDLLALIPADMGHQPAVENAKRILRILEGR